MVRKSYVIDVKLCFLADLRQSAVFAPLTRPMDYHAPKGVWNTHRLGGSRDEALRAHSQ